MVLKLWRSDLTSWVVSSLEHSVDVGMCGVLLMLGSKIPAGVEKSIAEGWVFLEKSLRAFKAVDNS
jgi:hypothetical protein